MKNINSESISKSPSILVLTDPDVDVKGRFGAGKHLGWQEDRSKIERESESEIGEDAKAKGKGSSQFMSMESMASPAREKKQRRIMVIPVSSDRALSQIREQSMKPITTIEEIRQIADEYSKRFNIPIAVSTDMGNDRYTDAKAIVGAGRAKIQLHPILQYRDREYIESRILSELEECQAYEKQGSFGWQRG